MYRCFRARISGVDNVECLGLCLEYIRWGWLVRSHDPPAEAGDDDDGRPKPARGYKRGLFGPAQERQRRKFIVQGKDIEERSGATKGTGNIMARIIWWCSNVGPGWVAESPR